MYKLMADWRQISTYAKYVKRMSRSDSFTSATYHVNLQGGLSYTPKGMLVYEACSHTGGTGIRESDDWPASDMHCGHEYTETRA